MFKNAFNRTSIQSISFFNFAFHCSLFSALIQFYHFYIDLFIFEMNTKNDQSRLKKKVHGMKCKRNNVGIGSKNEVNNNKESVKRLIFITIFFFVRVAVSVIVHLVRRISLAHKMAQHVQWYKSNHWCQMQNINRDKRNTQNFKWSWIKPEKPNKNIYRSWIRYIYLFIHRWIYIKLCICIQSNVECK